jgi:GNAT superfamily N-acetyltransferase
MAGATGKTVATRTLLSNHGHDVPLMVVLVGDTAENTAVLRRTSDSWQRQARQIAAGYPDPSLHAYFASDVAFLAAAGLGEEGNFVLVAQDGGPDKTGTIYGITLFTYKEREQEWWLDFQTTRPRDQRNFPWAEQTRGVGTLLLEATASEVSERNCTDIYLECLDDEACRFWRARGFEGTREPLIMHCPRIQQLAAELRAQPADDPRSGERAFAGRRREIEAVHPVDAPIG